MRSWAFGATPEVTTPMVPSDAARAAVPVIQTAVKTIRVAHKGDYADLSTATQVATLPWGELTSFSGARYPGVGSKSFVLHIEDVPTDDCMTFVRAVAPGFRDVWIGAKDPQETGATVFGSAHLDLAMLSRACHGRPTVGIDFIAH